MANEKVRTSKYEPLFESWHTDEKIGEGSFGVVYKVSKREMGETYESAVKIIIVPTKEQYREAESSLGDDKDMLTEYFEGIVRNITKEIKLLYSLSGYTNIISYQDHKVIKKDDEIGWEILIRMEYVTSLRKYLKEHSMTIEEVIQLGIDICTALGICSKKGIIHRDIKDENIFISDDGVFKLGDFGIARELSKSGRAASMRGTPLYMAPEIFRGEKYDASVDIYSLGIVLYKLLNFGRMPLMPPYPNKVSYQESEDALEKRMSGAELPPPILANGMLSNVVLKACAFSAIERYPSPMDMKRDLEKALLNISESVKHGEVQFTVEKPKPEEETEGTSSRTAESTQTIPDNEGTISIFTVSQPKINIEEGEDSSSGGILVLPGGKLLFPQEGEKTNSYGGTIEMFDQGGEQPETQNNSIPKQDKESEQFEDNGAQQWWFVFGLFALLLLISIIISNCG